MTSIVIVIYSDDPSKRDLYGVFGDFNGTAGVHDGRWAFTVEGLSETTLLTGLRPGNYSVVVRQNIGIKPGVEDAAYFFEGPTLTSATLVILGP